MIQEWIQKLLARKPASSSLADVFVKPWAADRVSIFSFLAAFPTSSQEGLPEAAYELPDDDIVNSRSGSKLRWAAGALDGAFGHHTSDSASADVVAIHDVLLSAARSPTADNLKTLYDMLAADNALRTVDPLLQNIRGTANVPVDRLRALARWLATESPDRGAVKFGIALLGLFAPAEDTDLLVTLGLHEEFTLYSVVALGSTLSADEVETAWWQIAQRVHGWGRIHIVERLANTQRADIRSWLLREGYKNSVMYEYLAYSCATGGNLLGALESENIDDALLTGAGEIIEALINGGPAEDISYYDDGYKAVPLYVRTAAKAETGNLKVLVAISRILDFVDNEDTEWAPLESMGWSADVRTQLATACRAFLAAKYWPKAVEDAWSTNDDQIFWTAARAGEILGLDVWEKRFERQNAKLSEQWYYLMRTDDPARIQAVIDLLLTQFDLATIATGPAEEMGLGPGNEKYSAIGAVLQDIGRFPGTGWPLVQAGLRSPVIRNRNMAIRALKGWGVANWPDGTRQILQRAFDDEPYPDTKEALAEVLALK
ncbi:MULTISPECIES: hypothetical protein [unclassified Duganella]|uniref:hypothetical protein n=1 Tax=unclassified Duganella TaxID=2636909 RepID=UPI0006F923FC|nr:MULTISPECIES: hypothetical protein [unclassified Duganella]KQV47467.1 hypothetical protein ASD07_10995 [Duganella sp. Root336D2]KRB87932.1 hypothetical protein ASE26_29330 [Duganella sp. Root198D2]